MDNKKVKLTWDDIGRLTDDLVLKIQESGNKFTSVFGVPRGGIHVAQEIARRFRLPLVTEPELTSLVVDDIFETGNTLNKYSAFDTATLFLKKGKRAEGLPIPLYVGQETDQWIVFPWEVKEGEDEGIQENVRRLIEYAGEDPNREGLLETPKRFEKAWKFWTSGYGKDPKDIAKAFENPNSGEDGTPEIDQLIVVPKIDYYSMCEHHLAPFYGQVHIGYLPNKKVLGLSKFARITDIFARRLQIQERLTQEIANAIMEIVDPLGVAVVVKGIHLCMRSRGVEKQNSEMVTSVMLGKFRQEADLRSEFLSLIH